MAEKIHRLVREKWYKMQRTGQALEWPNMEVFAEWFEHEADGQVHGLVIHRLDAGQPWGPSNCYLTRRSIQEPIPSEDIIKWNKTVNVFRRAAGLPLFREE